MYDAEKDKLKALYGKKDFGIEDFEVMDGTVYVFANDYKKYGLNGSPYLYKVEKSRLIKIEGYEPTHSRGNSALGDISLGGGRQSRVLLEDGEMILYTLSTIEDHTVLSRIELSSGKVDTILDMPGVIHFFDIICSRFVLCYTGPDSLPEIYMAFKKDLKPVEIEDQRCHIPTGSAADLTRVSEHNTEMLKDVYVAKPQRIDYESEGLKLHGWVLLPKGFDVPKKAEGSEDKAASKKISALRKYPAVLDIHGGPRCVYSEGFFHEMQVWAARGFVVMFTNIKGSDGRGDDFADIRGDYGGTDFKNLMDFVDAVLEKYPSIDRDKICETGGSYGGFMTNWIVTHTNRFCATASQRSISNWVSMSYISDIGPYFGPDQCGIPFDKWYGKLDADTLWKHSPLKYVDNAKTPTLFLHSDQDYRCPLPEAMQMMQAMTVRGVETRLIVFHGETHELSRSGKPKHRIRRLEEITGWFEAHVGIKEK